MDLEGLFTYSLANGSALGGHVQATASWGVWRTARALGTLELGALFGYLNEPNSNHPWNLGASTTGTAHRIPFVITAGHSFRFGRGDRAAFGVHLYAGVVHWISSYDVRFPSYGVAGSSTVERTVSGTARAATDIVIAVAVQASDAPIRTPPPIMMLTMPCAPAISASPAM